MKREHVYSKCIRCGWRQQPITASGPVSFEEYVCKECGDQLLICVDVRKAKDRNKKVKKKNQKNGKASNWLLPICVELNLHQMGLTSQVSAPENVVYSGNLSSRSCSQVCVLN